ncbi:MAG: polyprenyl diphosphate synthase [Dehalococcoidia bacterium]|nr:MAG: di-trans,poly-cis-decaprenylcistransferase [Chloroflexi bacterium TMED230]RZP14337.1 MAG: di-trans,poly-cis-decaprenylcistransferase [Chloroflexota bacterium]|tara:strand:- start:5765 stop:6454 length:690 start_codon:yes stop_codon:yes gene_type:complete
MSVNKLKPNHIAIIMDGNGRWAIEKGLERSEGHIKGYQNIKPIVMAAIKSGIKFLTIYAFSTENWNRSKEEIEFILNLAADVIDKESQELNENNVKISHLGSKEKLPKDIQEKIHRSEKLTENNNEFFLSVAFNYGSRNEIVETINKINLSENNYLTEKQFSANLSSNKFPDPDIIIRTGGQKRLSNFLLWESAYSELFFLDVFWPEFSEKDLTLVINEFSKRKRNFGT